MKAYVAGYREKEKEEDKEKGRKIASRTEIEVGYSKEPKWTVASREEANYQCRTLRGVDVHVGPHYCEFSVEELPNGEFAIVCLSHPDNSSA